MSVSQGKITMTPIKPIKTSKEDNNYVLNLDNDKGIKLPKLTLDSPLIQRVTRSKKLLAPLKRKGYEKREQPTLIGKLADDLLNDAMELSKWKRMDDIMPKRMTTEITEGQNPFITEAGKDASKKQTDANNVNTQKSTEAITMPNIPTEQPKPQYTKIQLASKRLRTYQPHIDQNWKAKLGILHKTNKILPSLMNNIDYQAKTIDEQVKLLLENVTYYKMSIVHNNHFYDSFNNMTHQCKVSYNKGLEELCGILLLIPQLLLMEFYQFVEKFNNVRLPDKKKFKDKYIYDECEELQYNLSLITELVDYFKSCFEVYLTLVKEVDDMLLKGKKYDNIICIMEKGRYDISAVIKRSENAIKIYKSDLILIQKHRPELLESDEYDFTNTNMNHVNKSTNLTDKLRNQFIFKNNDERQRISRINNTLRIHRNAIIDDNEEPKEVVVNREVYSIVNSKLVTSLLEFCHKDIKHQIISKRIHDEIKTYKTKIKDQQIVSLKI